MDTNSYGFCSAHPWKPELENCIGYGFCSAHPWKPELENCIVLKPFCTMIDWLSVTATGPFWSIKMPVGQWSPWEGMNMRPGAVLVAMDGTSEWGKRFYLIDANGGEKLATILAAPLNRKRHGIDEMVVQFANATLATGEWREIAASLWNMGCSYKGVQRLDIAADGFTSEPVGRLDDVDISAGAWQQERIGEGGEFIAVVQAAMAGFGRYFGKARWGTEHLGNQWNGFNFGTRSANKFLRCYRKKREMKAKGHKPHIVAAWSAALGGYDVMSDPREIGRLEVSVKGKELRRYFTGEGDFEQLAELHDPTLRAGVYHAMVDTIYDFRTWPKDGRARSAKPMARWDWTAASAASPPCFKRAKRAHGVSDARVKIVLHFMHDIAYYTANAELMKLAHDVAAASGDAMRDYFNRKLRQWQAECNRGLTSVQIAEGILGTSMKAETERERYQRMLFQALGACDWRSSHANIELFANAWRIADAIDPDRDEGDAQDDLSDFL